MNDSEASNYAEDYCRQIEAYLCRKNDGHLIRIVGPAFEQVCGWSERGVPLKVAFRGIDRYFERYYAKGPRRRPVRIEFCEADVLDVFDDWRRAVGLVAASGATPVGAALEGATSVGADLPASAEASAGEQVGPRRHQVSLPAHLDRVIARLTALRAGDDRTLDEGINDVIRELDAAKAGAKMLRGNAREQFLARLRALDAALVDAVRQTADAEMLAALAAEAETELSRFRGRMSPETYERSRHACIDRLLRERAKLPTLTFD